MRSSRAPLSLALLSCLVAGCEIFLPDGWGEFDDPCDEDSQCAEGYYCYGPFDQETDHHRCRPVGFGDENTWDGQDPDPCVELEYCQGLGNEGPVCAFFAPGEQCRCSTGCDGNPMCDGWWDGTVCIADRNGGLHCGWEDWSAGFGVACTADAECDYLENGNTLVCKSFENIFPAHSVCTPTCQSDEDCPVGEDYDCVSASPVDVCRWIGWGNAT